MKKVNKLVSVCIALTLVVSMFVGCSKDTKADDKDVVTKVVGTINGEHEISLGEYNLSLRQMEMQYEMMYGPNVWDQKLEDGTTVIDLVKENAWGNVKYANLVALVAKDKGLELTDEDIKKNEKTAKDFIDQYDKDMASRDGFTLDIIKKILNDQTLFQKLSEQELKDFEVNQEELDKLLDQSPEYKGYKENGPEYYAKQVRARHILFKTVDDTRQPLSEEEVAKAETKAKEVLQKAKDGEDFVTLVKEYSEDEGSVENGGEFVFNRTANLVPEFIDAAFNLEPGNISDLVKTEYGYHIIKLEEVIEPTEEEIKAVKDKEQYILDSANNQLKQIEFQKRYEEWIKDYKVEKNDEVFNSIEVIQSRNAVKEEENKDDESATDDSKTDDSKTDDSKADDSKADDSKTDDTTTDDSKTDDTTTDDTATDNE
ncbi:peptidylprolyl isomerase [Vallitalea longa]|uniref:Peptidylprolyl isomerase n=1 Tax=Vallitalea longa TaxID=2936439 RepID=A0A9W5YEP6_9FIRM|nr:peptidylprolyl isomerase [Vallitalea longa]GKX30579.1 peptidylprolyl isomerase [Vallitalea longa]